MDLAEHKVATEAEETAAEAAKSLKNTEDADQETKDQEDNSGNDDNSGDAGSSDDQSDDDSSDDGDDDSDDGESGASTSWMESEEDDDSGGGDEKKFTDGDAAAMRRKFKAKLGDKDAEVTEQKATIDKLQADIEALKKGSSSENLEKPKREDFDSEGDFSEALVDYRIDIRSAEHTASSATAVRKQQAAEETSRVGKAVDAHYERAAALSQKSGIKPEAYQAADLKVRQALESVFPGAGDAITDKLISLVGEGSEKVFYHVGVNPSKLNKFVESFAHDKSGLAASAYLGKLSAELSAPGKRQSNAPDPGDDVHGDRHRGGNDFKDMQKKYDKAHEKGDGQAAFKIKKAAKAKGADTKSW